MSLEHQCEGILTAVKEIKHEHEGQHNIHGQRLLQLPVSSSKHLNEQQLVMINNDDMDILNRT